MKMLLLSLAAIVAYGEIYSSPIGNDQAEGTKDHPL
jgi:hypothetical protein